VSDTAIQGSTAHEIADSIRALIGSGALAAGQGLPTVRGLADSLGVNRNTVAAAYRALARAGAVESRGRGGTVVAGPVRTEEEGFAAETVLRDLGSGNPDPDLLPLPVLAEVDLRTPALYGDALIDEGLRTWATRWLAEAPSSGSSSPRSRTATWSASRIRASSPASTWSGSADTARSASPSMRRA
jgi:DNA-binding transcriptional MocR family regulator